jgi:hypothetical protein
VNSPAISTGRALKLMMISSVKPAKPLAAKAPMGILVLCESWNHEPQSNVQKINFLYALS